MVQSIVLPYKAGGVAIADFVFVKKAEMTGRNIFSRYNFRNISDLEKKDLYDQILNDSRFSSWQKSDISSEEKLLVIGRSVKLGQGDEVDMIDFNASHTDGITLTIENSETHRSYLDMSTDSSGYFAGNGMTRVNMY